MSELYSTPDFEAAYTYRGNDLGAVWSKHMTTFRLWAPTAKAVSIRLYRSGEPTAKDLISEVETMELLSVILTMLKSLIMTFPVMAMALLQQELSI